MADVDPVILKMQIDAREYRNELRNTTNFFQSQIDRQERAIIDLENQLGKSTTNISLSLKSVATSVGTLFTGKELVGIIDAYTQFENRLKVAGVAAADMGAVQDRLFASAQKYGVEIGTLGELFGTLTNASKELGATQQQVFKVTDAVSAALKVSGTTAQAASGALQQLGQALRGGKIQAEEYNSLLDGLYPLLEAAANGSQRFGGSVANLTKAVKDGKVSSKEFFDAIVAGTASLEQKAAKATLTLSGAYTTLTNAITVYVGEAAKTSGAQSALATGLTTLAENVDTLISALAIIGATMAVRYVASAGAAALATLRMDAALLGLTTRAEVAGFAIGALGRALAINGLIAGVVVAMGAFASEAGKADAAIGRVNGTLEQLKSKAAAAKGQAAGAATGVAGVGTGAASAEPKVRSFAGAVGELAQKLYEQAKAARAAKLEMLGKRVAEAKSDEIEIGRNNPRASGLLAQESRDAFSRGDIVTGLGLSVRNIGNQASNFFTGGRTGRDADRAQQNALKVTRELQRQLREAQAAPLQSFIDRPPALSGGGGGGGGGKGGGSTRNSAAEAEAKRLKDAIDAIGESAAKSLDDLDKLYGFGGRDKLAGFGQIFGREGVDFAGPSVEDYNRQIEMEGQSRAEMIEQSQRKQEESIYVLSNILEDAFTSSTDQFWQNFQRNGLRALAVIIAKAAVLSFSSGGGGFGSFLGNIGKGFSGGGGLLSLFGRASGGYVGPGQTVRVNEQRPGVELLRMGPQGGTVIPLGQAAAARPSATTIVNAPQFNLKGAVVTRELYADMQRISNQSASLAGQAAYRQAMKDAPGAVGRTNRFGTTA